MLTVIRGGRHACGACGYDLSGLRERGACPECGRGYARFITRLPAARGHERARLLWTWPALATVLKACAVAAVILGSCAILGYFAWRVWAWIQGPLGEGGPSEY